MKTAIILTGLLAASIVVIMAFKPPGKATRDEAIGSVEGLSKIMKKVLDLTDFLPMNEPGPHDWLANHLEPGQTYDQYLKAGFVSPDKHRNTIYLQPIGAFDPDKSPSLKALKDCATAYFSMKVKLLPKIGVDGHGFTTRTNPHTKNLQILTHDILKLLKKNLPRDAFCVQGITMQDLYPEDSWNFVFGMASLYERVAIFSFARYDPAFYGASRGKNYREVLLRRSCKVLTHETGHMFGLPHCIYFQCGMAGSNHLQESDSRPIHLCPVCLRKLHHNVGFDAVERYRKLKDFYAHYGLLPESQWVTGRLKKITQ